MFRSLQITCFLLASPILLPAAATDWPQFRGPESRGIARASGFADQWSETENVSWKVPVPGRAWSSPIVVGNRIFVTTVTKEGEFDPAKKGLYFGGERPAPTEPHVWLAQAYDLQNGRLLWQQKLHQSVPPQGVHIKNTYASETPIADDQNVYVMFGNVGLFALSQSTGKTVWEVKLPAVKTRFAWGSAASPVIHKDRIYVVYDNEDASFMAAYDKKSGTEIWKHSRDEKSNWATPLIWTHAGGNELVTPGTGQTRSYDLDGKLIWHLGGFSSITIATPYAVDGLLYISSGYVGDSKRPLMAVKPGGKGDLSLPQGVTNSPFIAWSAPQAAPYNPTTLVYEGLLYVLFDYGFLACHDAKTGALVYEKQRLNPGATTGFTASPWAADGKIFCLSEDGDTYVVQAGRNYQLLRKNSLNEMSMATPALAGNQLVLRTQNHLYNIQKK